MRAWRVLRWNRASPSRSSCTRTERVTTCGETPSRLMMKQEMNQAMQRALTRLPADYQRVIELRHRDNLSFGEVAAALGRSEAAARKLWARAIKLGREETENEVCSVGE